MHQNRFTNRKEESVDKTTDSNASGHISRLSREYLADREMKNYSPKTIDSIAKAMKRFIAMVESEGVVSVQAVKTSHMEAFRRQLRERRLKECSVEQYTRSVRTFFNWLAERHLIFVNPGDGFVIPKPDRRLLPVPSVEEMARLLDQPDVSRPIGLRDRALLETGYSTGARLDELVSLKVNAPDLGEGRLRLMGKGRKERVVPLGRQAVRWLRQYLDHGRPKLMAGYPEHDRLWVGARGEKLSGPAVRIRVRDHARAAGIKIPVSPHTLRRACATHMLANGAHPVQLQRLLGHADFRTLSQYLRVSITDIKAMHEKSKPGQ